LAAHYAVNMTRTVLVAIALVLSACSTGATASPNSEALAHGAAVKALDAGKLDSLPTGPVYIRFIRFVQPVGYDIVSKQHVASVVYVEAGAHRLVLNGKTPLDLVAGQAKFHQSVAHVHVNPGPVDPSVWYSIAIWPSSARGQSLVDKTARPTFESEDISREALPQVAYSQVLRQVTLAKLGTTGAHKYGGLAAFYVLTGSLTIKSAHGPQSPLAPTRVSTFCQTSRYRRRMVDPVRRCSLNSSPLRSANTSRCRSSNRRQPDHPMRLTLLSSASAT
jgi:hypothetical protein